MASLTALYTPGYNPHTLVILPGLVDDATPAVPLQVLSVNPNLLIGWLGTLQVEYTGAWGLETHIIESVIIPDWNLDLQEDWDHISRIVSCYIIQ